MYKERVLRSFVELNDGWAHLIEADSRLPRNNKSSNRFATSNPNCNCHDPFSEQEQTPPSTNSFGFSSEQERNSCSYIPDINDLRSSSDMLDNFLDQMVQHSHSVSDIGNYLSSTYLNPKLNSRMTNFAPSYRRKNFPRI